MADRVRGSATLGKVILIGVLAVVLVAVLYIQFGGSGSAAPVTARKPARARPAAADHAPAADVDKKQPDADTEDDAARGPVDEAAWVPPDLATVIAYDPFALPAWLSQPRSGSNGPGSTESETAQQGIDITAQTLEQMNKQLEELRQLGVKVILKQQDQYVALIGDQTIHVGDEINGFTVTAITPSGVRVERKIKE